MRGPVSSPVVCTLISPLGEQGRKYGEDKQRQQGEKTEIKGKGEELHDFSACRRVSSPLSTASLKPFPLCALQSGDLAESSKSAPCPHPPWRHQVRSFQASCQPRSPQEPTITRRRQNQQHRDMLTGSSLGTRSTACDQPQPLKLLSDTPPARAATCSPRLSSGTTRAASRPRLPL